MIYGVDTAVIACGGFGTRLKKINKSKPKCLTKLQNNKTILLNQIEELKKNKINYIYLLCYFESNQIIEYIKRKKIKNVHCIVEKKPLGDFGSIIQNADIFQKKFIYILGDIFFNFNFKKFINYHNKKKSDLTIYGHKNNHYLDSDKIVYNSKYRIVKIVNKFKKNARPHFNLINSGISLINGNKLLKKNVKKKIHFVEDFLKKNIKNNNYYLYRSFDYVEDIGTPDRLKLVNLQIKNKIPLYKSFKSQKFIFINYDFLFFMLQKTHILKFIYRVNKSEFNIIVYRENSDNFHINDQIKIEQYLQNKNIYVYDYFLFKKKYSNDLAKIYCKKKFNYLPKKLFKLYDKKSLDNLIKTINFPI